MECKKDGTRWSGDIQQCPVCQDSELKYQPWVELNISEAEYWKKGYLEVRQEPIQAKYEALQADFERSLYASNETTNKLNACIAKLQAKCDDYEKALEDIDARRGSPVRPGGDCTTAGALMRKAEEALEKHKVGG